MKFKTNAKCMGCVSAIRKALSSLAPEEEWNFDLESPDRIMTYTGNAEIDPAEVIMTVENAGFKCGRL